MKQFCLALFFLIVLSGCEEKVKPSVLSGVSGTQLPSQESWNSKITFSDSGIVKAIVHAGHIYAYDNSRVTHLDSGVVVDFFDEFGKHTTQLTSVRGAVDEGTNNLEATGNVVVKSDSGTTVYTEKMFWTNQKQLIHSPEFVRIISPKEQLQGTGFESDHNLRNYRIFKVTGTAESK
ncbi:MAG: LPS export ABC transporter periplasmic protein LptC [Ignavibacteriales bacterium]|nr:LPS export ABC transporter periplasmic protein LptC [Ignavibacteriales bacterium]